MNRLLLKTTLLPLSLVVGFLILPSITQASGILGGSLIVQNTGNVTVTFGGSNAGYTSTLYLQGSSTPIFSSNATVGQTFSLGSFDAGTELSFSLAVQNTGNVFFTGAGANNIDGIAHALVESVGTGTLQVGFEDLLGGGDRDYNDLIFFFDNTETEDTLVQGQILGGPLDESDFPEGISEGTSEGVIVHTPEPSTIALLGSGLLGLGAWRLRKKQA